MASGRMLDKDIALSEKLAALKTSAAAQLWLMLTPHLDINGCQEGNPARLKGLVCPMDDKISTSLVSELLEDLFETKLLVSYEVDGKKYVWCPKFILKQRGYKRNDETPLFPLSNMVFSLIEAEWSEKSARFQKLKEMKGDKRGLKGIPMNPRQKGRGKEVEVEVKVEVEKKGKLKKNLNEFCPLSYFELNDEQTLKRKTLYLSDFNKKDLSKIYSDLGQEKYCKAVQKFFKNINDYKNENTAIDFIRHINDFL